MDIWHLTKRSGLVAGSLAAILGSSASARAESAQDFYKGKTLNLIVSTQEGGSTDSTARIVGRHMSGEIPGKLSIVVRNMPGAGHLRATHYMYSQAPKDGTTFAVIWRSYVMHQIADGRNAKYDSAKFSYIGSTGSSNSSLFVWHKAGVRTIEDAKKKEVVMGATGAGSDTVLYPTLLNNTLKTRFRVITGYKGGSAVDLAMQRGEVEGKAGASLSSIVAKHANWLKNKQIHVLVQIGDTAEPGFEDVPLLATLAKDPETKEMFQLFSYGVALGRPFLAPPGVPADRIAALRTAFQAAVKKPALAAEFKKGRIDLVPIAGERLTEMVKFMVNGNPKVLDRVKSVVGKKRRKKKK